MFWRVVDFLMHPTLTAGGRKRQEKRWKDEAVRRSATHIIERWDDFEMESIPYYVTHSENVDEVCERIRSAGAHSVGRIITIKPKNESHNAQLKAI